MLSGVESNKGLGSINAHLPQQDLHIWSIARGGTQRVADGVIGAIHTTSMHKITAPTQVL
jgi:hypothetical protein